MATGSSKQHRKFYCAAIFFVAFALLSGCAYKWGYGERGLPGGYKQLAVPVFTNKTPYVGVETPFTNALIQTFARSRVARVVPRDQAPVVAEGEISDIEIVHGGKVDANETGKKNVYGLPDNTVLTTEYRVLTHVRVLLRRVSDRKVIWEGTFNGERVYQAPQVGLKVLNSVNPLYNNNARFDTIAEMANDMMADAHDRMTENF